MLVLEPSVYAEILDHAEEDVPREACGILAGRREDGRWIAERAYRTANVADAPRVTYVIDPEEQLRTMETVQEHGRSLVGFYHSHPAGPSGPSRTDHEQATWPDHYYLIASLAHSTPVLDAWRWSGSAFAPSDVSIEPPEP